MTAAGRVPVGHPVDVLHGEVDVALERFDEHGRVDRRELLVLGGDRGQQVVHLLDAGSVVTTGIGAQVLDRRAQRGNRVRELDTRAVQCIAPGELTGQLRRCDHGETELTDGGVQVVERGLSTRRITGVGCR